MESKKNEKYDLERKRPLFFGIGLIIALAFTISAFEWRTEIDPICLFCEEEREEEWSFVEIAPVTKQEELKPPKPKATKPIQSIDATKELEETAKEIDIEIDIESSDEPIDIFEGPSVVEEIPDDPFIVSEIMPAYPGGENGIYSFIRKNMSYPAFAKRVGAEGLVSVQFIIEKDGSVKDAKVLRPLGYGMDEEAIRVIQLLQFEPGKQRGVPVRVQMTVPIKFQLK